MDRLLPLNIVMLLCNLYKSLSAAVSWNGFLSKPYHVFAVVRQGGSISPVLSSVYVNSVIEILSKCNLGCSFGLTYLGVIMYADDLLLILGSVSNLQKMFDKCLSEFSELDLHINASKSMCLRIGQRHSAACDIMSINGAPVPWANSLRYLGVTISSGHKFAVDLKQIRAKFYRSFNALYCKIPRANECVIISLVKTFCIPLVTYYLEALCLNNSTLSNLDNMLYNAFGKIFKTYDRTALLYCMFYLNYLSMKFLYYNKRVNFLLKIANHDNPIVVMFFNIFGKRELQVIINMFCAESDEHNSVYGGILKAFENSLNTT